MAPIEQYLMDRDAEIALARSAAPDAISHDASVIVLTRHGYETAGKNGWVCWVGRGWMACSTTPNFGIPKFAPRNQAIHPPPAPSSRTPTSAPNYSWPAIPSKKSSPQSKPTIDKKELPALEQGTVSYRMSKDSYLGDYGGHNAPHMMFFETAKDDLNLPRISDKNLGRKLEGDYR
jgi:hypothetical protein